MSPLKVRVKKRSHEVKPWCFAVVSQMNMSLNEWEDSPTFAVAVKSFPPVSPNQREASVARTAADTGEERNSPQAESTFLNIAFTFGSKKSANPLCVSIGQSSIALIDKRTRPTGLDILFHEGAVVSV